MNEDQRRAVEIAIESHRRTLQVLQDEKFMEGVFESWAAVQRGERGTPGREITRKYTRKSKRA